MRIRGCPPGPGRYLHFDIALGSEVAMHLNESTNPLQDLCDQTNLALCFRPPSPLSHTVTRYLRHICNVPIRAVAA